MRKLISITLVISVCMVTFTSYASNEVNTTNEVTKSEELNTLQEQRNEVQTQIDDSKEKK